MMNSETKVQLLELQYKNKNEGGDELKFKTPEGFLAIGLPESHFRAKYNLR